MDKARQRHPDEKNTAFSQMPKDLGVPRLIAVAKGHPREEVRKQAVFWLGQANDDRAREALVDLVQGP